MGENPLISDGRWRPLSLMENPDNLSENFDASVKILPPPPPPSPLPRSQSQPFWKLVVNRDIQWVAQQRKKEKKEESDTIFWERNEQL
jgi:hypothetical protein